MQTGVCVWRGGTSPAVAICESVTGKNNCWHAISINYKVKLFHSYCGLVVFFFFSHLTRLGKCSILNGCVISLK